MCGAKTSRLRVHDTFNTRSKPSATPCHANRSPMRSCASSATSRTCTGKIILWWSHMTFHSAASDQFAQVVGASDLLGHVVVLCGESELQRDLGVPQPVPCWFATELMGSCGFTRAWKLNLEQLVSGKNDESMTSCISRKLWTIVCHGR